MHALIGISLVVHLLIFMHVSGIYRSKALSYIELTMMDISKPFRRSIPQPRMRHKTPKIQNVKKLNIQKQNIPHIKIDPVQNNLTIKSHKKYPVSARLKHIEGRVKVRFVITRDGMVSSLTIVKQARHRSLETAALNAVKNAAPFPRPPAGLFNGPLDMEISIVFELGCPN